MRTSGSEIAHVSMELDKELILGRKRLDSMKMLEDANPSMTILVNHKTSCDEYFLSKDICIIQFNSSSYVKLHKINSRIRGHCLLMFITQLLNKNKRMIMR